MMMRRTEFTAEREAPAKIQECRVGTIKKFIITTRNFLDYHAIFNIFYFKIRDN